MVGIFIPFKAYDKAPDAITDLQTSFTDGSLTGKVSFKCPTTLFDGTAASGNLTYKIMKKDSVLTTGPCSYGQAMSVDLTVPKADLYTIAVVVTNSVGDGPVVKTKPFFIGKDTPKPTEVSIAYENGAFKVNWKPVTTTVNGGYMDVSKLSYNVTRFPDSVVVAQNLTDTTYVDKVAEPEAKTSFYYTVITECDGISSSPAESNTVDLGNYVPPYEVKSTSSASINEFTVIDANNDGKKWKYSYTGSNSSVNCAYSSTKDMDDWLISPKIKFHGGKTYKFAVEVRGSSTTKVERFELKLGKEATAEAQTLTVIDTTEVKTNKATTYEAHFTVPETGLYNLGFHGISEKKNGTLLYKEDKRQRTRGCGSSRRSV